LSSKGESHEESGVADITGSVLDRLTCAAWTGESEDSRLRCSCRALNQEQGASGLVRRLQRRTALLALAMAVAVAAAAAVLGKQACSLGVLERGADRLAIGLGLIPRGEVSMIFASIGAGLTIAGARVVNDAVFSAVVVMVALMTLMTPPLLVWRMGNKPVAMQDKQPRARDQ